MKQTFFVKRRRTIFTVWLCLLYGLITSAINADESQLAFWHPHKHPAIIERRITGFTAPSRTMDVSTEFNGRIESVLVHEGDRIADEEGLKGSVVILDRRFATIARDRAKTALDMATQQRKQLHVELALAERQLEYHQNEVKRIEELAASGKVTQSNLDAAVFDADSSALQVKKTQTAILLADITIVDTRHILADAEERLARHSIDAPTGWTVLQRMVEPGTIVEQGQTLLRLADTNELAIELRLSEAEISALSQSKTIALSFPHHDHTTAHARIHRIDVNHDPVTNKRLVELRIPGKAAPSATGGLEVSLTLNISDPGGLVLVPNDFLTLRFEQYFVTLKDGNESTVIPLREQGNYTVISSQDLPAAAILMRPEKSAL